MLKRPCLAILKIGGFIAFLFILGLLPWIDNWAHVCGFLFGFLLAFSLLPYVSFGEFDRGERSSELFYPWEGLFSCLSFLWCCFMYCLCTTVLGVSTLTVYRLLMTFVKTWRSTIKGNPLTVPISDIFLVMNKYRMWL